MLERPNLTREIILTLVIKVLVIYALWLAFFSQPVDENLSGPEVAKAIFNVAGEPSTSGSSQNIKPEIDIEGERR
jgi:hypothetical protein